MGISQISMLGFLATTALLVSSTHAASPEKDNRSAQSCNEAVARSRMICVSSTNCQREIGEILRACRAPDDATCATARRDLRAQVRVVASVVAPDPSDERACRAAWDGAQREIDDTLAKPR